MRGAAKQIESELASLGLDDEPPVEPETPPENMVEPVGVEDPSDEPDTTDRERAAKTAQALARAVDQMAASFEAVRQAAHALCEALEPRGSALVEDDYDPEGLPPEDPQVSVDTDDGAEEKDGEEDGDDEETA